MAGQITPDGLTTDTAGAGFWSGWPEAYVTNGPSLEDTPIGYFDGSIGQAAVYPQPLGGPAIARQYALAESPSAELTQVTMPSGRVSEQASYDSTDDRVVSYTDPAVLAARYGLGAEVVAPLAAIAGLTDALVAP